jgi:hypothetical protein
VVKTSLRELRQAIFSSLTREQKSFVDTFLLLSQTLNLLQMVARHKIIGAGSMKGLDFTKSGR